MTKRPYNFYAGPAAIPLDVLKEAQAELLDFAGMGLSVMEISHRSKPYDAIHTETMSLVKELMGLGDDYEVLLLQGGASLQFAMIPMNLLSDGASADYLVTGTWSKKALKEAKIIGTARAAANTELDGVFKAIPAADKIDLDPKAAYCHITSNNTIYGTQWQTFPDTGNVPLVADMSSDILSRPVDVRPFGMIYAGAQKNLGPSGLALVIIRKDMLERCVAGLPTMLSYKTHADNGSLFNTAPTFAIYIMNKVLGWIKDNGGTEAMAKRNTEKAQIIYGAIDGSNGYYTNTIAASDRSKMNIVFNLTTADLESAFVSEATKAGFIGIKGHRSIGGVRVSVYNAADVAAATAMADFMKDFMKKNG